jgi:mRNA-degrading endonuclease RelE of RelBE toxin-antitoxin system
MFTIEYAAGVADDLVELRAFDRQRIIDTIHEPAKATRNKKTVVGLEFPWEHAEPVWELRIGQFRVFYDVANDKMLVTVRAVRRKPLHTTTKEIV